VLAAFVCFNWYFSNPPSYLAFTFHRSQRYYSHFADACVQLLDRFGKGQTNEYRINGDDTCLPATIKEVRASYVMVTSNSVGVVFDISAAYGVWWRQDEVYPKSWRLASFGESGPYNIYAREESNALH